MFRIGAQKYPAKAPVMIQGPHIGTTHGEHRPFAANPQQLLADIGLQLRCQPAATIFREQINQLHIASLGLIGKTAKLQLTHPLFTRPDMNVVPLRLPQPFSDPLPIAVDKVGKAVMGMKTAKIGIPACLHTELVIPIQIDSVKFKSQAMTSCRVWVGCRV